MNTYQDMNVSIVESNKTGIPRLLSAKEVADNLNISLRQVYDEVREGRLAVIRI